MRILREIRHLRVHIYVYICIHEKSKISTRNYEFVIPEHSDSFVIGEPDGNSESLLAHLAEEDILKCALEMRCSYCTYKPIPRKFSSIVSVRLSNDSFAKNSTRRFDPISDAPKR